MSDGSAPPDPASCPRCGGATEAVAGVRRCRHCGARSAIAGPGAVPRHDLFSALAQARHGGLRDLAPTAQSVACQGCGAVTVTDHHAVRCPFCGGTLVAAEPRDGLAPDAVAAFVVEEPAAAALVQRWLRRRWFAPGDLHRAAEPDHLQRVYVPYWSFSVQSRAVYVGQRGEATYHTETRVGSYGRVTQQRVRKVRWQTRNGHVRGELRDFLVPATTSLPASVLEGLGPWRSEELLPFSAQHLHGALAERYRVDLAAGFAIAKQRLEQLLRSAAERDLGGDEQRVQHLSSKYDDATFRHVLLPVWSTGFRYRGRIYRVVINGQTGRLQGSRPYSRGKLAAAVLAVALATAAAWWWLARPPRDPLPEPEPAVYLAAR